MQEYQKKVDFYGGVIVPMVTPLTPSDSIDELHAKKLIRYLHNNKTTPFILGTTGEVTSIPIFEREVLIKILISNRKPKVPLLVGMGGLTAVDTIALSNKYLDWGIDAVVLTAPSYFGLNREQLFGYFHHLASNIHGDIILYNIPATIHASIPIDTIDRLSRIENIVAIKDSENNEERLKQSLELWRNRDDFMHLVGVNSLMELGLKLGSSGIVPSSGNLVPYYYHRLFNEAKSENWHAARKFQNLTDDIGDVYKNGFLLGESLAALKYLMSLQDLCSPYVSPPLTMLSDEYQEKVKIRWREMAFPESEYKSNK